MMNDDAPALTYTPIPPCVVPFHLFFVPVNSDVDNNGSRELPRLKQPLGGLIANSPPFPQGIQRGPARVTIVCGGGAYVIAAGRKIWTPIYAGKGQPVRSHTHALVWSWLPVRSSSQPLEGGARL